MAIPIWPEMRWFYPVDRPQLSRLVLADRARGLCQECGRLHGKTVRRLPDGRRFDVDWHIWRDDRGPAASWPDVVEATRLRQTRVVLAAAHLEHAGRAAQCLAVVQ